MVADATLRRISARLSVLRHLPDASDPEDLAWRDWIVGTLAALGDGQAPLPARPETPRGPSFARLAGRWTCSPAPCAPAKAARPPSPRLERGPRGC